KKRQAEGSNKEGGQEQDKPKRIKAIDKTSAFEIWKCGEPFEMIARRLRVAEATVEIYVIDSIALGQGNETLYGRMLGELDINQEKFEVVKESLTKSAVTLREIRDLTSLRYNQIRAVIAVLINAFQL
ncbi:unnamed protein product, partial [Porites evermanni]